MKIKIKNKIKKEKKRREKLMWWAKRVVWRPKSRDR